MTASVLLVGCGNIGFRHLQALCEMRTPATITVVEPNSTHHARIRDQFTSAAHTHHEFDVVNSVPSAPTRYDLVIVATSAMHRRGAIDEVFGLHDVNALVLEKVLFQTTQDLDEVETMLSDRGIRCSVNCGRRTFPGYQTLREMLPADSPVHVTVNGAQLGLASNAIHFLDLAEFLNHAEITSVDARQLAPGSVPARHVGCVDVFGVVTATVSNGARLRVQSRDEEPTRITVLLEAGGLRVTIDELARTITVDGGDTEPFESQNVSETFWLYDAELSTGHSVLTPYADSARQHRVFLDALRQHLGLSVEDDAACPIS